MNKRKTLTVLSFVLAAAFVFSGIDGRADAQSNKTSSSQTQKMSNATTSKKKLSKRNLRKMEQAEQFKSRHEKIKEATQPEGSKPK